MGLALSGTGPCPFGPVTSRHALSVGTPCPSGTSLRHALSLLARRVCNATASPLLFRSPLPLSMCVLWPHQRAHHVTAPRVIARAVVSTCVCLFVCLFVCLQAMLLTVAPSLGVLAVLTGTLKASPQPPVTHPPCRLLSPSPTHPPTHPPARQPTHPSAPALAIMCHILKARRPPELCRTWSGIRRKERPCCSTPPGPEARLAPFWVPDWRAEELAASDADIARAPAPPADTCKTRHARPRWQSRALLPGSACGARQWPSPAGKPEKCASESAAGSAASD